MENESQIIPDPEPVQATVPADPGSSNLPLGVTLVALLVSFAFQTAQLYSERSGLRLVKVNQENAIQESEKIQAQFKTIVMKTTELANQGHASAKFVVEELQKRGVAFAPEPKSVTPEPKPVAPAAKPVAPAAK